VVDRRWNPEADGGDVWPRFACLFDLAHQQLDQLVLGLAGRMLALLVEGLGARKDSDEHLRAPEIDPDRLAAAHEELGAGRRITGCIAMISSLS
jgi:hypothetical protein